MTQVLGDTISAAPSPGLPTIRAQVQQMRDRMAAAGLVRTSAALERTLVALARCNSVRDGEAA